MPRLLAFAVSALLLAGCQAARADRSAADGDLTVRRGSLPLTLIVSGELEAARGEPLSVPSLPFPETAIKWIAEDGAVVRAGERVVELDNGVFTNDLDSKRQIAMQTAQELQQRSAQWRADIEQLQLDVDKKKGELEKATVKASVPADIVSLREYEERKGALRTATVEHEKAVELLRARHVAIDAERRNLELQMNKARREIERAETALEALVLTAPRDGIVVVREHWEGRKLQNGDNVYVGSPIALIPDLDSLRVRASLADVDDGRVEVGMPATVTLDAYGDRPFRGRVAAISAVAQESRRASLRRHFDVLIELEMLDHERMRPGLSARVVIDRGTRQEVLLTPRAALDFSGDVPRVRLRSGAMQEVELGACNAQHCVVVRGLDEGTRLSPVVETGGG